MRNDQIIRQKREKNAQITGIAMTLVLHVCALALVSASGLKYIYPPPQEQSLLIDFSEEPELVTQQLQGQEPQAEEIDLERPVELAQNREAPEFCGISLLRPAPPRNLKLAPKRYVENAKGKFLPHSPEEQEAAMRAYAATLPHMPVAVYCHYCEEGLELAGVDVRHLAAMLFAGEAGRQA